MNPSQTQIPVELFEALFEAVQRNLLDAIINFKNWDALWPTEETVAILNLFDGFFMPTRPALLDRSFIRAYNVVDPTSNTAPSLYRLLTCAEQSPSLTPALDTTQLRRRLKKQSSFRKRLKTYRDRRAAYYNTELTPASFNLGEYRSFLGELQDIFQQIYISHTNHSLSFDVWERAGTKDVLASLSAHLSLIHAAIQVTTVATKDNDHPERYFVPSERLEALQTAIQS